MIALPGKMNCAKFASALPLLDLFDMKVSVLPPGHSCGNNSRANVFFSRKTSDSMLWSLSEGLGDYCLCSDMLFRIIIAIDRTHLVFAALLGLFGLDTDQNDALSRSSIYLII